jgi:hypothetical protein
MRLIAIVVLSMFVADVASPALAWGPLAQPATSPVLEQVKYKEKWKGGGCKYEYKADNKGIKEKYKCK